MFLLNYLIPFLRSNKCCRKINLSNVSAHTHASDICSTRCQKKKEEVEEATYWKCHDDYVLRWQDGWNNVSRRRRELISVILAIFVIFTYDDCGGKLKTRLLMKQSGKSLSWCQKFMISFCDKLYWAKLCRKSINLNRSLADSSHVWIRVKH